jgi:hypothetical protein
MSGQQKRGFRLPWAERSTEDGAGAATLEADADAPTTPEAIADGVGGDLGDGPFHFADAATPDASTDASPEAPEVPQTTAEAAMIETDTVTTEPAAGASTSEEAWPTPRQDSTSRTAAQADASALAQAASDLPAFAAVSPEAAPKTAAPTARVEPEPRTTRSNPLVAGLVKAMREAALASREETTGRLTADATAQVELLREAGTGRAAELRKRADEDVAGIRDWSKSEVARIKQETDERIETRKSQLAAQTERHEANVEHQVQLVQGTVAAFEADMDRFFERLLAENDPAKLAALAEQAPEPPDLAGELAELEDAPAPTMAAFDTNEGVDPFDAGPDTEAQAASEWDDVAWGGPVPPGLGDPDAVDEAAPEAVAEPTAEAQPALEAEAAAQAEAASTEGLEMPEGDAWPSSVLAAARRTLHHPGADFEAAGVANSRLYVNGLTSVAGISAFKGALGQLPGVRSVSVSSGEPGVFIFTVVHSPETDLQGGVAGLAAFSARVTEASDDSLTVVAEEPAA